jgi:hypothetical protein
MHLRNIHRWTVERLKQAVAYISVLPLGDPHRVDSPAKWKCLRDITSRAWSFHTSRLLTQAVSELC